MTNEAEQHQSANSSSAGQANSVCSVVAKLLADLGAGDAIAAVGDLGTIAGEATKQTQQVFDQATEEVGKAVSFLGDNPVLRQIAKWFRAEWLLTLVGGVDASQIEAKVSKFQQEYPHETQAAIAHRIIVDKALYAGGIGLASSLIPGVALALLAIDVVATTQLQAEMVYEIAAVYGMDLRSPSRRGEVLVIFGLSLGGSEALKLGLGLLRNIPLAGIAIGASTNAAIMYTVGFAACRFYEAKVNSLSSPGVGTEMERESEADLAFATAQQAIMDRVLVHQVLASFPGKSWPEILPELQRLNLSPQSLTVLATHLSSPQPLQVVLGQLHRDYAIPLLARCYAIAQLDGTITPQEQGIIDAIARQFDLDLQAIEAAIKSHLLN